MTDHQSPDLSPEAAAIFRELDRKREEANFLHWRALTAEGLLRMILIDCNSGGASLQPHRLAQLQECMADPEAYAQKKYRKSFDKTC